MKKKIITAGVDEVGRGCLAGPVVSAAVVLKKGINLKILKDSKKITFNKREKISKHIKENSYFAIGIASVEEILKLNILQASLLSMKRALNQLTIKPDITLIDGKFAPEGIKKYKTIINGDEKVKAISAASIIAKVYRDKLMIKLSEKFSIWLASYKDRLSKDENSIEDSRTLMDKNNPKYILRNYLAQSAIEDAEQGKAEKIGELAKVLSNPYVDLGKSMEKYCEPAPMEQQNQQLSCSS